MFKRFASIAHSKKYAYAYDSQAWDSHAPIESHFRQFSTYGDGLVQHSPDWSVQVEFLADYLMSLAQAMLTDDELARDLFFTIHRRPSDKEIAFAASVIYKPPKEGDWKHRRTYFSAKEMKVSKAPSKEHDKRYEEVRDFHDGTSKSIYRILIGEYSSGLTKYIYAEAIRDWPLAHDGYMELAAEFLGWFKDDPEQREKSRQLRDAYEACRNITESYRLRAAVESQLENYKRHVTPELEVAPAPEQEVDNEQTPEEKQADEASPEPADAAAADKVA